MLAQEFPPEASGDGANSNFYTGSTLRHAAQRLGFRVKAIALKAKDCATLPLPLLVNIPPGYHAATCCRAPFLPVFTRDVMEHGLLCQHCNETLVPAEDLPEDLRADLRVWADKYQPVHEVAHWEGPRQTAADYDAKFESAAQQAEDLLSDAGRSLVPKLAGHYPALVWEDQDECLEVRPEDIEI